MIGAGSFGTVKFALCLIGDEYNKTSPAEVICIKKSKHNGKLKDEDDDSTAVTFREIL